MHFNRRSACRIQFIAWTVITLVAATSCRAQSGTPLQRFFERLAATNGSPLPSHAELLGVTDQIASMPSESLAAALPAVITALSNPNDMVKLYAVSALLVVSRRTDGGKLLVPHLESITNLFDESDQRLQSAPALLFMNLLPSPPPQAVPLLVRFVRRTDREPLAQVRAIFTLIATAPSSNEVVACITDFLHRTRSVQTQVDVLNALGNPRVSDERLLDAISQALGSPDEQVRRTAIEVIGRIGPSAVRKSKNRLEAVAADNSETSNVRAAAVKVLKEIR